MGEYNFRDGMIQYVLWNTCKNNCDFCLEQHCIKNDERIKNVNRVIELLDLDEAKKVERISLIGGEIFDTDFSDELRTKFYNLIYKIFNLNKRLFLMTNLLYDRNKELVKCIEYIKSLEHINDTVICTSYDLVGRFHNQRALEIFKSNFDYVKDIMDIHIEMVLSNTLLTSTINNDFSFKKFFDEYTDNVDFIPPYPGLDERHSPENFLKDFDFFPKRETFFKFLKKCFIEDKVLKPQKFLNRDYHSCILYYFMDGIYTKNIERQTIGNMQHDHLNYIDAYRNSMTKDYFVFKEMYNI